MDQASKLRELLESKDEKRNPFRVITVSSGKGGVGKSNFVINLAIALTQQGKKVAVLDADFGMANVDILLGINPMYNIYDIVEENKSILDVIVETSDGIKIIPGGSGINKFSNMTKRDEEIIINEFDKLKDIDILIIDTGAGIGINVMNFIKIADNVIIITNSEPTSITDAYGLIKVASKDILNINNLSVVVNRVSNSYEADETYSKINVTSKKFLGVDVKYLGYILEDKNVSVSVKKQQPFIKLFPNSKASGCIDTIGRRVLGEKVDKDNSSVKGYISRLFNLMRG